MSVALLVKFRVQAGRNAEFEAVFAELTAATRSQEPGNAFYALHRSRSDAQLYVVMQSYRDQAALEAHLKSAHFTACFPRLNACLAGAPDAEILGGV